LYLEILQAIYATVTQPTLDLRTTIIKERNILQHSGGIWYFEKARD
jgi:hypothetical protein